MSTIFFSFYQNQDFKFVSLKKKKILKFQPKIQIWYDSTLGNLFSIWDLRELFAIIWDFGGFYSDIVFYQNQKF